MDRLAYYDAEESEEEEDEDAGFVFASEVRDATSTYFLSKCIYIHIHIVIER